MPDSSDTEQAAISVFVKTTNAAVNRNDIDRYPRLGSSGNNFKLHPTTSEAVQCINVLSWQTFLTRVQRQTLQTAELKLFSKSKNNQTLHVM